MGIWSGRIVIDVEYAASIPEETHHVSCCLIFGKNGKMKYLSLTLEEKSWQTLHS